MSIDFKAWDDPTLAETLKRDGVVFIEGVLAPDVVAECRRQLEIYEREVLPTIPRSHYDYQADGVSLHQYRDVERFSPWFDELIRQPRILELVARAVPWDPMIFYLEVFPKPPGAHGAFPHQDLYTAPVDPPHFLHLWIPLEDVTSENGGIFFYPGTHKLGLAPHVERPGSAPTVHPNVMKQLEPFQVQVSCAAGSAAMFGGDMVHHSGPNTSDRSRPALVIGLRGKDTVISDEVEVLTSLIARMYREELGLPGLDGDQDFRTAGGTDEAAERILKRLSGDYAVTLPRAEIDAHPTPALLAARVLSLRDNR